MPLPRSTDQQKGSDKMKTRSGQETPGKTLPSSGSPNIGTIDKPDKIDKVKQLKLVQELDGAVGVASPSPQPSPQPATVEISIRALLEKMDKKLEDRFQRLESKLASKFDSLQEDVRTVREEVADSKIKFKELDTKVSDIIKSVEFSSKTCEEKDKKQTAALREMKEELECKVKALENKLLLQEKHDRKYNLLFYGIPEEQNEDIEDKLKNLFVDDLKLDYTRVNNMYFAHGHRIPSKTPGPKPIILRFSQYSDRDLVLSNAYQLAGSRRRIIADWPVQMKNERGRLSKVAFQIRKDEKLQTRIKDKGLDVYLEVRKDKNAAWVKREA